MRLLRRTGWWLVALPAVFATPGQAADLSFTASVDRPRIGEGDPVRLTLAIKSSQSISHMPAPEISLSEFEVEGPVIGEQQLVNIVNGSIETSFVRTLEYALYPRRVGKITIGPARLNLGGKSYSTRPIQLEVVGGSRRQKRQQGGGSGSSRELADNLFVLVNSDRSRAYVGQQVSVSYDLYYNLRLFDVGFKSVPSFSGFWVEELFVAQQLRASQVSHGGQPFNVAPLRKVALFPTTAGTAKIEPLSISCDIPSRRGRRSLFDSFGLGGSAQSVEVASEPIELEVLPLPKRGQPVDFSGVVGSFNLQARAQPLSVPVGDPVTLKVSIAGQGNMAEVVAPDLSEIEGFKVYDPTVTEKKQTQNGVYGGSRIFEYIFIPESPGRLEIPAVRFDYFDPGDAEYKITQSRPILIEVSGEAGSDKTMADYGLSRKDIKEVGRDIRHIKPDLKDLEEHRKVYERSWFWVVHGLMPLAYIAIWARQRHYRRLVGDVAYARRRRARSEAEKRLRRSRDLLEPGSSAEFHAEIHRAVTEFLADKMNLAAAGLTNADECRRILERGGAAAKTARQVADFLIECDFARFAPTNSIRASMKKRLDRAEQLIAKLEVLK